MKGGGGGNRRGIGEGRVGQLEGGMRNEGERRRGGERKGDGGGGEGVCETREKRRPGRPWRSNLSDKPIVVAFNSAR